MKRPYLLVAAVMAFLMLAACQKHQEPQEPISMSYLKRDAYTTIRPEQGKAGDFSYQTDAYKLYFFGTEIDEDFKFSVKFPSDHRKYRKAWLSYTMCGWNEGPSAWDMTTIVSIKNKKDGKWYEFTRAFTPYGGAFDSNWSKTYYMDITEFLPMMENKTDFRIYYCGWDTTDKRAHALKLGFDFYEGKPEKDVVFNAKIYDSSEGSIPRYRRCWPYGCEGYSIEGDQRLGPRTITVPAGVRSALVRVDITGHGMDPGVFPNRPGYQTRNAAEFDYNYYTVMFNGVALEKRGYIFEPNGTNYSQAGNYMYDRAGWGPGKPANVQYWEIRNIPAEGATISLDFNLEEFKSAINDPNHDSVAYYIIEADLFGFDS